MEHLLLFDIDATLLLTGGAGMRSMLRAGTEIMGPELSWEGIEAAGGLDPLLFREAVARSGLTFSPERHDAFRRRYAELLAEELRRAPASPRLMPGVLDLLAALRERPGVVLGLLTGNYGDTARLKLEAVGIDPGWFRLAVFGDEGDSRPGLVALALERYGSMRGRPADPRRVVVVGDTPRDVTAARENDCLAVGVATGSYGVQDLLAAGADAAVADLRDPAPLWALIDGAGRRPSMSC